MMSIRAATEDVERLWAVAASLGQKHQVTARVALRLGLAVLERTPVAFVGPDAVQRGPKTARKVPRSSRA